MSISGIVDGVSRSSSWIWVWIGIILSATLVRYSFSVAFSPRRLKFHNLRGRGRIVSGGRGIFTVRVRALCGDCKEREECTWRSMDGSAYEVRKRSIILEEGEWLVYVSYVGIP